jgi:predicted small metal-binding protein
MLKVSCADLGARCKWTATAETGDELKRKLWEHAERAHKDMLSGMTETDKVELEARIDALIEMQGG